MKKGFWAAIAAVGSAIIAALLYAFIKRPAPPTPSDKAAEDIKKVQAMTDEEIRDAYVTNAEKEKLDEIIDSQVNKAMRDAEANRRRS